MPPAKRLKKADGQELQGSADADLLQTRDSEEGPHSGAALGTAVQQAENMLEDGPTQAVAPSPWAGAASGAQLMDDDEVDEHLSDFLDDESQENGENSEEEDDEEGQDHRINDPACPQCDDGGTVLYCDGNCMRSFHVGIDYEEYSDTFCNPMGMPEDLYMHLKASNEAFECPNCLAKVHQCFKCKEEGIADPSNPAQNIYRCPAAACGRFYHPGCLKRSADDCQKMLCPLHSCCSLACKFKGREGEALPCRRCPKAYHYQCIPQAFYKDFNKRKKDFNKRVWLAEAEAAAAGVPEDAVDRSLVYCKSHPIVGDEENPKHERALMRKDLIQAWRGHYAQQFPALASSKKWLAENPVPKASPAAAAPRAPASSAEATGRIGGFRDGGAALGSPASQPKAVNAFTALAQAAKLRGPENGGSALAAPLASPHRTAVPAASLHPSVQHVGSPVTAIRSPAAAAITSPIRSPAASLRSPAAVIQSPDRQQALSSPAPPSTGTLEAALQAAADQEKSTEEKSAEEQAASGIDEGTDASAAPMEGVEQLALKSPEALNPPQAMEATEPSHGADETRGNSEAQAPVTGDADVQGDTMQIVTNGLEDSALDGNAEEGPEQEEPAGPDFTQPEYWTEDGIQKRNEALWAYADQAFTFDGVLNKTRRPQPYQHAFRKTITENKLGMYRTAFKAVERDPGNARQFIDVSGVKELHSAEDNMRIVMAPWLHKDRYTSYGRHFTMTHLLQHVAMRLQPLAQSGDTVVDFSCGANEFVPMFKRTCLENGKDVQGRAFDIITPRLVEDFTQCSWFDVPQGALPPGDRLIIGLNPPFGKNNSLAEQFSFRAAEVFHPRIIVLIVPPATRLPAGYDVLLEDRETMRDKAFYIPGLSQSNKAQWNKDPPAFRILTRRDMPPLLEGTLCLQHMAPAADRVNHIPQQQYMLMQQQMHQTQQHMKLMQQMSVSGHMMAPY